MPYDLRLMPYDLRLLKDRKETKLGLKIGLEVISLWLRAFPKYDL